MMPEGVAATGRVRAVLLALMVFYIGLFWVLIILDIVYWLNY
ncbi:MAG TPA: hypothetical protein PKY31_16595 [Spirochaetota bacterium]|nr:hypothetical protein [Spirochaetota bacterium]